MKRILIGFGLCWLAWAFVATAWAANDFAITDDFVAYLKTTTNPHEFGLKDGRFYPYSTPHGRRIGYAFPVEDKALYRQGSAKVDAEKQLRAHAEAALTELKAYLAAHYPEHPFTSLSRKSQEILLDYACSEGAANLQPEFYAIVIVEDWPTLFDSFLYIRWVEKGWPDTAKNKAFADRWLDPKSRLRP